MVCVAGLTLLAKCSTGVPAGSRGESVASASQAVFGATDYDTTFPAVGYLGNCSATLITDDVALTAAHCVSLYAQQCETSGDLLAGMTLSFSATGHATDLVSFVVNGVAVLPTAFGNAGACSPPLDPSLGPDNSCSGPNAGGLLAYQGPGNDLALLHILPAANGLPRAYGFPPVSIVTGIGDSVSPANLPSTIVHVALNFNPPSLFGAGAGGASGGAFIAGWGIGDDVLHISGPNSEVIPCRRSGYMDYVANEPFGECRTLFTCSGVPDPNAQCGGNVGQISIPYLHLARNLAIPNGPVAGHGDSGGGVLVYGGTNSAFNPVPALQGVAGGPWFVVADIVAGDNGSPGQETPGVKIDAGPLQDYFAPTYSVPGPFDTGGWIEHAILAFQSDQDSDGIPDYEDNCPTVNNPSQEDTNYLAEFVDEQNRGCADFPNQVCPTLHQPPSGAGPFSDAFHAFFKGDACDEVVSAQVDQSGNQASSLVTGPCNFLVVTQPGGLTVEPGPNCPQQIDTELKFQGWVGNDQGAAPTVGALPVATAAPTFCRCDGATGDDASALQCQARGCTVANDATFPVLGNVAVGWKTLSQKVSSGTGQPYDWTFFSPFPVYPKFQERIGAYPDLSSLAVWDFPTDWPAFGLAASTTMTGVLWSNVNDFEFLTPCPSRAPGCSRVTNLNNSYRGLTAHMFPGVSGASISPVAVNPDTGCIGCNLGGAVSWWWSVDPEANRYVGIFNSAQGLQTIVQGERGVTLSTSAFAPSALSLLSGVVHGTSQLLVADDAFSTRLDPSVPPALLVATNTSNIQGALVAAGPTIGGVPAASEQQLDPPDRRAYDAADGALYALHASGSAASIDVVSVVAALQGTVVLGSIPVVGSLPQHPLAFAWNHFTRALLVVDTAPARKGRSRLRLLTIDPASGQSTLLWQTEPTEHLPDSAFLSVGVQGYIAIGLVGVPDPDRSEVIVGDANGRPLSSLGADRRILGPPRAVHAGVELAFVPKDRRDLVELVTRKSGDLKPGVCGAGWLRHHADATGPGFGQVSCVRQVPLSATSDSF